MQSITEILSEKGPLAKTLESFAPRKPQQEMAEAVMQALDDYDVLICEAGTGTGKTMAYLVPALLSGNKVIISTGTKNLQDQLYYRDLPQIRSALAEPISMALLKGRANYLCLHRLKNNELKGRFRTPKNMAQLQQIHKWSGRTKSGDIAEFSEVPEDSPIWFVVTSTTENCLGQECQDFNDCHLMKARRKAQKAEILVVNHHLFFADMALRDEGFGELLPGANAVIFDEAHQLPEVASHFFGTSLSGRQLLELCHDARIAQMQDAADMESLLLAADRLEKLVRDMRLALGVDSQRAPWINVSKQPPVIEAIKDLIEGFEGLESQLELAEERSSGLKRALQRCKELNECFVKLTGETPEQHIHWFETLKQSFVLHLTPMNIADIFSAQMKGQKRAWVFTSATLAVNEKFDHFSAQLGLFDAQMHCWESPFDYQKQTLLYLPTRMPAPAAENYTQTVVEAALPVLNACGGRTFMLFTSHRALKEAAEILQKTLEFPLLVQGTAPRNELLTQFRSLGNAVLLGSSSFWEGVDVRGEALSCVIIDKLPFASPGDPVLQARLEAMRSQGKNPFRDYQLPNAVITLKQGAGRLIRDVSDRGVLMLCDPRLLGKSYGKIFLDSLPPMKRTRMLDEVIEFYQADDSQ